MVESCATCRFFDQYHCRAQPPQIITLFSLRGNSYPDTPLYDSKPWGGWPLTGPDDWCGAWCQPVRRTEPNFGRRHET